MKFVYKKDDYIIVFRIGLSKNRKIVSDNRKIVQTYAFSVDQYNYARNNKISSALFDLDEAVCFDCPFRGSKGKCYTHKYGQTAGMFGLLRSIKEIVPMPDEIPLELLKQCAGRYVRFGSYGEPVLIPLNWVSEIAHVAKGWTGYTHQWQKPQFQAYQNYFMASGHNRQDDYLAQAMGWRSFIAGESDGTHCPASKEIGFKSNCAKCGLCSGILGKGKKSVYINEH